MTPWKGCVLVFIVNGDMCGTTINDSLTITRAQLLIARTVMSFHYYSCRYLPPLPSTHVCLSRGLQWRLDKNSPKINHSISQPSENNCLYFHQISTLDLTRWLFGCWGERSIQTIQSLGDLSTAIENQGTHLLNGRKTRCGGCFCPFTMRTVRSDKIFASNLEHPDGPTYCN